MRFASTLLALALAACGFAVSSVGASAVEPLPTRLALAMPLTVPPETTGLIPAEILETYTSPTGILTRRLDAIIDRPIAIGLDPMIVASIRILGNTAPESAIAWLSRLESADNEIFALSYADSDIASLSQAGSTSILQPTSFDIDPGLFPEPEQPADGQTSSATPTPSPTGEPVDPGVPTSESLTDWMYTIDSVVWPRQASMAAKDLGTFNANGPVTTILSSGNVATADSASATINDFPVLVSDDTLSMLLGEAIGAITNVEWQAAIDRFTMAVSSWSNDSPTGGTLLATLDRNQPGNSNRLAETLTAISVLPGIEPASLGDALAEPRAATRLVETPATAERVSRMRLLLAAEALIGPFSTVLDDPAPLTGERRLSLLALSSNSWISTEAGWNQAVDDWLARSNTILNSVQIAESSTLNFGQEKGNLPISVSNGLDFPVTVYVTVSSETGILVTLNSRVPIELEANSQGRAFIPVQAIANGEATLQVSLSSETGIAVSTPKKVTTNVVAGWETAATFIIAALLLVIFIAGIVRTVIKRKKLNAASEPAEDAAAVEHGE